MPHSIQKVFILLGPALFAASIYTCFSRIIQGIRGNHHSFIKPNRLTRTFVTGDGFSFLVQGSAAGLTVTGNKVELGEDIVIGGLIVQIIMFGLFVGTAVMLQKRIGRSPTLESCSSALRW